MCLECAWSIERNFAIYFGRLMVMGTYKPFRVMVLKILW